MVHSIRNMKQIWGMPITGLYPLEVCHSSVHTVLRTSLDKIAWRKICLQNVLAH